MRVSPACRPVPGPAALNPSYPRLHFHPRLRSYPHPPRA